MDGDLHVHTARQPISLPRASCRRCEDNDVLAIIGLCVCLCSLPQPPSARNNNGRISHMQFGVCGWMER